MGAPARPTGPAVGLNSGVPTLDSLVGRSPGILLATGTCWEDALDVDGDESGLEGGKPGAALLGMFAEVAGE